MTRDQSGLLAFVCFLAMMALVAISAVGCAAPVPPPQPTPQVVRVEVPGPQPTPQIIEKTVEVPIAITPQVCVEALIGLDAVLQAENDMLMRYAEGKEPTEAQWDAFLAGPDPEAVYAAADECLALAEVGS